jgi:hypothetical protein
VQSLWKFVVAVVVVLFVVRYFSSSLYWSQRASVQNVSVAAVDL